MNAVRKDSSSMLSIVFAVCAATILVPPLRYSLRGLVWNERFYLLMPTSYWLKLLKDGDSRYRKWAACSLGKLGPEPGVVAALTAALKDKHWHVHCCAATSLGQIGPAAKEAFPVLVETLKSADAYTGNIILKALERIDPDAVSRQGLQREAAAR